jgi:hypothetical protein
MGFCAEFGPVITEGCDHLMVAGVDSCSCPECGAVCRGQFEGCSDVWVAPQAKKSKPAGTPDAVPAAVVAARADPADAFAQDELLQMLQGSLSELTDEFRAVVASVKEQGEETRALLVAQTDATTLLMDAIRMLPRQLEAVAGGRASDEEDLDLAGEPIELLRPEVVRFDHEPDERGESDPWAARSSRWGKG